MVDRILIFASTTMIILKVVYILRDVVSESFSKNVSRARIYIWSLMGDRLGFLDSEAVTHQCSSSNTAATFRNNLHRVPDSHSPD